MLHLSWANQAALDGAFFFGTITRTHETVPLNDALNHLAWCVFLESPVEEEVLIIHDKSYAVPCFSPSRHSQSLENGFRHLPNTTRNWLM